MQENSQRERFKAALAAIRLNVSEGDRKVAMQALSISAPTLSNYLNGKGENVDIASKLLDIFQPRISEREKQLEAATA